MKKAFAEAKPDHTFREIIAAVSGEDTARAVPLKPGKFGSRIGDLLVRNLSLGGSPDLGGYLEPSAQPTKIVDSLPEATIAKHLGAQFYNTRDFSPIPLWVAKPGPMTWFAEGVPVAEDTASRFGLLSPELHSGMINIDYTRALQTGGLADKILGQAFLEKIGEGVDHAVFHGSGSSGQPDGIKIYPDVDITSAPAIDLTTILAKIADLEALNVRSVNISFAMGPDVAALLRGRVRVSGGERMILEGEGGEEKIHSTWPAYVSPLIDAGHIFLGDFSKIWVYVADVELLYNPYSQGKAGIRELCAYWFGDVLLTVPTAIAVFTDVS